MPPRSPQSSPRASSSSVLLTDESYNKVDTQTIRLPESSIDGFSFEDPTALPRRATSYQPAALTRVNTLRTAPLPSRNSRAVPPDVLNSVVKLIVTSCSPTCGRPWQKDENEYSSGSAFILPKRRLLTNAHVAHGSAIIRAKKRSKDKTYAVHILSLARDCDLALLGVSDDEFWRDTVPLRFGSVPDLQNPVLVIGYPEGGNNISLTAGVVSRIELNSLSDANRFLTVQIDAAINCGNSGGPTLNENNDVIGVAFQKLNEANNIGYLIAIDVVERFLKECDRGGYRGSSQCGFAFQSLQDIDARRYFRMLADESGILVTYIQTDSNAEGALKLDDVVLSIDDVPLSNSGTVAHPSGELLPFHWIISRKFVGDTVSMSIIRDGERINVSYELENCIEQQKIPWFDLDAPKYLILAGIVFIVLTYEYTSSCDTITGALISLLQEEDEYDVDEFVVVSQVLDAEINVDHIHLYQKAIVRFNGEGVRSLQHLADMVDSCKDPFLRLDFSSGVVIMDRERALASNADIAKTYNLPGLRNFGLSCDDDGVTEGKESPKESPKENSNSTQMNMISSSSSEEEEGET